LRNNSGVDPQTTAVDPHRIMRAEIPFGPEVSVAEAANGKTTTDRGLMFVCYQTSIPNQFEFVQIKWANNSHFISSVIPTLKKFHPDGTLITAGFDPIIGQNGGVNANPGDPAPRERFMAGGELSGGKRSKHVTGAGGLHRSDGGRIFLCAIDRGADERMVCLIEPQGNPGRRGHQLRDGTKDARPFCGGRVHGRCAMGAGGTSQSSPANIRIEQPGNKGAAARGEKVGGKSGPRKGTPKSKHS
jgi:hypothetical protein